MIQYPINLTFKIQTLSNDFTAVDAAGNTLAYVRQKMLKLKEHVVVFSDEQKTEEKYHIKADRWLDFNTSYQFTNPQGDMLGRIVRKGWRSIWKSHYKIYDTKDQQDLLIQEENAWVKMGDALLNSVGLSLISGYVFNPKYTITRPDGTLVAKIVKQQSFWGRRFSIEKISEFESGEEERILLGTMMMILLERRRG